jgi:hypothetical protein
MQYLGTKEQSAFIDGIFNSLITNNLVKEHVHYELHKGKSGLTPVWQDKLHNVISECALKILEAIDE